MALDVGLTFLMLALGSFSFSFLVSGCGGDYWARHFGVAVEYVIRRPRQNNTTGFMLGITKTLES